MSKPIDMNKFNTLISQATDAIMCNSECKKQKQIDELKQIYLKSQANLASAPVQLQVAQKNYVTFTQGETAYNDLLDNQLEEKAQTIADKFTETFEEDTGNFTTKLNTYQGLLLNYKNISELYLKYKKENIQLIKDLKDETNDVLTNERKTFYEDQKIDGLKFYYYYFLYVIYIICFICFVIFSFMYPSNSNFLVKIISIIGFLILPFVSSYILSLIIYLFYKGYELLPKNVYK
jgi:hypothetical protein